MIWINSGFELRNDALAQIAISATLWSYGPAEWTPEAWRLHGLARRGFDAARAVGLPPAIRGQPGYWSHLDGDGDGISCEPWPGRSWWTRRVW